MWILVLVRIHDGCLIRPVTCSVRFQEVASWCSSATLINFRQSAWSGSSEMIACGKIPVIKLDKIYRQSYGSRIPANAKLIRHGNLSLEYGDDFQFFESALLTASAHLIEELYLQETSRYGIDHVALLSPYRQKTETGVNANEAVARKGQPGS